MDDLRGFIVWISKVVQNKDQRGYESFMNIIWRSKNSDIYNNFFAPSPNDGLTYWDHATKALEPIIDYVFGDFQVRSLSYSLFLKLTNPPQDGDHHTTNNFCDDLQGRAANSITSSKQQKVLVNNGLIEALGLDHAQQIMGEAFHDLLTDLLANPPSGDNGTPNREANYEEDTPGKHDEVISGQNSSNDPANSNECANGDQSACQKLITDNQGWLYQTCSELGYFFTKDNKPDQLTFRNVTYSIKDCVSSFGSSVSKGPSLAPLQKYGDNKQLNPSNTFWVDGQYDPWRSATVNALDSGRYPSNVIPESGKTLQGNNFFGAVINNTYHVPLQSCSAVVLAGEKVLDGANPDCEPGAAHVQQLFLDALEKWLPKFEKHSLAIAKTSATPDRKAVNGVTSDASSLTDAVRFPAGMLLLLAVAFVLL